MRVIKMLSLTFLVFLFLFSLTGCQKDSVAPSSPQGEKTAAKKEEKKPAPAAKNDQSKNISSSKQKPVEKSSKPQETSKPAQAESSKKSSPAVNKSSNASQTASPETGEKKASETKVNKIDQSSEKSEKYTNNNTSKNTAKSSSSHNTKKQTSPSSNQKPKSSTAKTAAPVQKKPAEQTSFVTISVIGDKGTILSAVKMPFKEGDTVLETSIALFKQKHMQYSVRGSGAAAYVEGINNLYEFDKGPLSGWNVKKNGTLLPKSAGAVKMAKGDRITWIYTADYKKEGQG